MKLTDNDIKKALRDTPIPDPSNEAKNLAMLRAAEEFAQNKQATEKTAKGFPSFLRHIGKSIARFLTIKGEPIMTRTSLATISVAVIAAGVFLTIGINSYFVSVEKELPVREGPAPVSTFQPGDEGTPTVPEPAETPVQQAPLLGTRDQLDKEIEAALQDVPQQQYTAKQKEQKFYATAPKQQHKIYDYEKAGQPPQPSSGSAERAPVMRESIAPAATPGSADSQRLFYKDEGRDLFPAAKANRVILAAEQPVSTFSIDVDTASYGFVRRQLHSGVLPQKNAVRIEEMINYFDYEYVLPTDKSKPFAPTVAVYPTPWNSNTKILHVGIKGYDITPVARPRSNLVFLIDVSGSMNSPDKLPLLKNSMAMLVNTLSPEDMVAIAVYAGAVGTVLEPTKISEKGKILAAMDRLQAGGSTAGGAGINLAYSLAELNFDKQAVNRVILATDGDFNVGITNREELKSFIERKRQTGIFLSVLGFGQGNYNDALMQVLAQNGNGIAAYIDTLNEARKVLVDEADSTLFTIAKDVKIQVEFNPAMVHDYRLIGYETRLLNREDFNNDQVDAGDVGSGASITALYEITPVSAKEKLVDPLRYQDQAVAGKAVPEISGEYGFVKIRYKLPDSDTSSLITQPVGPGQEYGSVSNVPADLRFAASVAAFGQLLRQDPYTKSFSYDDVIKLADPARGRDSFGLRAEFLNLVRLAKSARSM